MTPDPVVFESTDAHHSRGCRRRIRSTYPALRDSLDPTPSFHYIGCFAPFGLSPHNVLNR